MKTLGEDKVRTGQVVVALAFALASNSKHSYQEYFIIKILTVARNSFVGLIYS